MLIRNISTKKTYTTTKEEYDSVIVAKGLAYKYDIVEDDTPIEIKSLRAKLPEALVQPKIVKKNTNTK